MELVVLNVACPFSLVGADAVGDGEKFVTLLDTALTDAGHDSIVMACEGSVARGILLATQKPSSIAETEERRRVYEEYRYTLQKFVEKWPIDLIHMHGGDFHEYLPLAGLPVLATLHLPVEWYPQTIFHLDRPETFLHCASPEKRAACPPCANLLQTDEAGLGQGDNSLITSCLSIYERLVNASRAGKLVEVPAGELSAVAG